MCIIDYSYPRPASFTESVQDWRKNVLEFRKSDRAAPEKKPQEILDKSQ